MLSNYVSHIIESPRYLSRAKSSEAVHLCSMQAHSILPWRDRYGRRVFLFRPGNWDPDRFTFTDCYALGYMLSELIAFEPKTQV